MHQKEIRDHRSVGTWTSTEIDFKSSQFIIRDKTDSAQYMKTNSMRNIRNICNVSSSVAQQCFEIMLT